MTIGTPRAIASFTRGQVGAVNAFTLTTTSSVNPGESVFLAVSMNAAGTPQTVASATDSGGNTYLKVTNVQSGSEDVELWWCPNALTVPSGGTIVATFTGTYGGSGYGAANAGSVSGLITSSSGADVSAAGTYSATQAPTVTSPTMNSSYEFVVGVSHNDNSNPTYDGASGFTNIDTTGNAAGSKVSLNYQIVTSSNAVTYLSSWSASGNSANLIGCFLGGLYVYQDYNAFNYSNMQHAWSRKVSKVVSY